MALDQAIAQLDALIAQMRSDTEAAAPGKLPLAGMLLSIMHRALLNSRHLLTCLPSCAGRRAAAAAQTVPAEAKPSTTGRAPPEVHAKKEKPEKKQPALGANALAADSREGLFGRAQLRVGSRSPSAARHMRRCTWSF